MSRISECNMVALPELANYQFDERILSLKNQLGITYSELSKRLGKPCAGGSLQARVKHPKKPCSKSLATKLDRALNSLQKKSKTKIKTKDEIARLKKQLKLDIQQLCDDCFQAIDDLVSVHTST